MASTAFAPPAGETRENWVRLGTLILLRWAAIFGQVAAISLAVRIYGIELPLGWCFLTVGLAIIANLVAVFVFPANKRLSEVQTTLMLLFDTGQLALLLGLTGGLDNPFALLILAPGTIGATVLPGRASVALCTATILLVTLIAVVNVPLRLPDGSSIAVPPLYGLGTWLAMVIGVVFLGLYAGRVSAEIRNMGDALLATQMALAREQKLTDLGGVVAAAAHELGTPLATIKLVSAELADELDDRPELREDAELIRAQADRCRDILRSMGQAGKDDLHLRSAPLMAVIREAAEPHAHRGKSLHFEALPGPGGGERQPAILRRPEVIHGLRNLVQNAVDFARANVWIDALWTDARITLRIIDDGPGFPQQMFGRIGDPFMRRRRSDEDRARPGYEGMGLGLFIAKTLLERTGAELSFANGGDPFLREEERPPRSGAIIEVSWPREAIEAATGGALGENTRIVA